MKVGTDSIVLGAWAAHSEPKRILDIGSGTGVLALILAQRYPEAEVVALEIDSEAAGQAQENVSASPWPERIQVLNTDALQFEDPEGFDLLVSNPPYFQGGLRSEQTRRNMARHTDTLPHDALVEQMSRWMTPGAASCVILPTEVAQKLEAVIQAQGLHLWQRTRVHHWVHKPARRTLLKWGKSPQTLVQDQLIIKDDSGYSEQYTTLTQEFHWIK